MKWKKKKGQAFSRRLQFQLMLVFMITIAFLVGSVSLLSYQRSKKVIQEQSADIMQQYFKQTEYSVAAFTDEIEKVIRLIMVQGDVQEYMRRGWKDEFDSVHRAMESFVYINTIMGNYEYLDSVYCYGKDGTALGVKKNKNMVTREKNPNLPWYKLDIQEESLKNRGKILWFGGYTNQDFAIETEAEEIPYITAASCIWLGSKKYATVVVNIRQNAIANFLIKSDAIGERESYLMDEKSVIIAHTDEKRVRQTADVTIKELKIEKENYFMEDNIQLNYYEMKKLPWTIVTEIPKNALYGNLDTLKFWFAVLAAGGLLVGMSLSAYSIYRLTAPLKSLRKAMERMEKGALGEQLNEDSKNELGMLGRQFNRMSKSMCTMVEQIREMEQEKRILEKEALQGQLNPHFLFNTLSNMRFMAKIGRTEELENCFGALGCMLQPMYRSAGEFWSLRQEMEYMSNYIKIMNYRFGGKLSIEFELSEILLDCQVLKFMLQPLVENAIEHGFAETGGEGMIVIGAEKKEKVLLLYVEDNGSGITKEKMERLMNGLRQAESRKELYKNHVGVANVHRRLKVHFGEAYGVEIESVPGEFTCIYLNMPVMEEHETEPKEEIRI